MRLTSALAIGCLGALITFSSAPARADVPLQGAAAVPLISADQQQKIRDEIRIQENRARELDPVIARDRQARRDVEQNWIILERHAKEMRARANDFREIARGLRVQDKAEMDSMAGELETYAGHDEENARYQHEIAERLDKTVTLEVAEREWHMKHAEHLRQWLNAHGG